MQIARQRKYVLFIFFGVLACVHLFFLPSSFSEENKVASPAPASETLTLVRATMCEEVVDQGPRNPAAVFSIQRQQVYCFSLFDSIVQQTYIHHSWYRDEKLITKIKLLLHPPRWATISRIQLREADRGPWRVEITDQDDNVLKILRFSVTD
ncbi:DUF2914 domain-containing protein [Thermodesulfobacteriota bacterium]